MKGLDVFLAVAMSKTLSEAANLLNLSPSTISYNLKKLECTLGFDLIDRKKGFKSIRLTPAGEILLPLAIKWGDLVREISNISCVPQYYLSIGSVESVNQCMLPSLFRLLGEHNVDIKVETKNSLELYQLVENRTIDIAFVINQIPSKNLDISFFSSEGMKLIRSCNVDCINYSTMDVKELNIDFEIFINWSFGFQIWHRYVWPQKLTPRFQTSSLIHVESFLLEDDRYWIIVPDSVAEFYAKKGFKVQDIFPSPPNRICYKLAHRNPSTSLVPSIEIFNNLLEKWSPCKSNFLVKN